MEDLPLVFAPGMMCDAQQFVHQTGILGKSRAIFHADFSQDSAIADMATRLLRDAPDRFYLAGLSMGGIVAFDVWRQAPDRVAGLALMNTTAFADSPARRETRLSQIDRVAKGDLKTVVMEELKPNYLAAPQKQDKALLAEIYAMAERLGPDTFIRQSHALMGRVESTSMLATINCPTLIIAGAEDEVCPPELHEIMQTAIPGSILHTLEACGHLSTMEAPSVVTRLIADHLTLIKSNET